MVKNLLAVLETRIQSLGWEDPLEEDMATHWVFLPGESHGQRGLAGYIPWGPKELDATQRLTHTHSHIHQGAPWFPDSSVGKEYVCNAGDPGSIPGLGRAAGEGHGYPLQCSWASLVAQLVKNLPARWETWVQSLGLGRSPGEEKGCPLHYSGLENSMDCIVHGVAKSQTWLGDFHKKTL